MPNEIISGLFVLLGAVIASGSSVITALLVEKQRRKHEIEHSVRDKREQIYIKLASSITPFINGPINKERQQQLLNSIQPLITELSLYMSENIAQELMNIMWKESLESLQDSLGRILREIRKELSV